MPIYEYRCSDCSHEFEIMQSVHSRTLRKCPECAGKLEKLISRTSFQLKGGGWFDQGYGDGKGGKAAKEAKGGTGAKGGEGAKATKKTEASGSSSTERSGAGSSKPAAKKKAANGD